MTRFRCIIRPRESDVAGILFIGHRKAMLKVLAQLDETTRSVRGGDLGEFPVTRVDEGIGKPRPLLCH